MKKLIPILCGIVIVFCSCSNDEEKIKATAQAYLDAMGNYRIEEAYPYATPETQKATLDFVLSNIMPRTDANYIKSNTPATVKLGAISIINDSVATVSYSKTTPIQVQNGSLQMRKRGRDWKAHVIIDPPPIFRDIQYRELPSDTTGLNIRHVEAKSE